MLFPFAFPYAVAAGAAPTLTLVATNGGAVGDIGGAYTATLTGTNFTGATGVTFGGTAATSLVVVNATTITCTVPAHATGAVSVVVTTPSGSNGANTAFRYFSPAELSLTNWNRSAFSASPWAAVASAGTSGTNGTLAAGAAGPTAGTALNGRAPATYNGTTQTSIGSTAISSLLSAAAWSLAVLDNPVTTAVVQSAGAGYGNPAVITDDTNGFWYLTYTTSGYTIGHYDGVGWKEISIAATAGSYHLVQAWYDGTNLNLQVDSGGVSSLAAANLSAAGGGGFLRLGANYTAAQFCANSTAEDIVSNVTFTAQNRADIKSYVNTRNALTL